MFKTVVINDHLLSPYSQKAVYDSGWRYSGLPLIRLSIMTSPSYKTSQILHSNILEQIWPCYKTFHLKDHFFSDLIRSYKRETTVFRYKMTKNWYNGYDNFKLGVYMSVISLQVVLNIGDGFNPSTGVFTVPSPGIYAFLATASSTISNLEVTCKLDLMVAGHNVAYLCACGETSCTTHAVCKVNAGDTVYLKAIADGDFQGGWCTSFTGMLLQPELWLKMNNFRHLS